MKMSMLREIRDSFVKHTLIGVKLIAFWIRADGEKVNKVTHFLRLILTEASNITDFLLLKAHPYQQW